MKSISLNGEARETDAVTVAELLLELGIDLSVRGTAVAQNDTVVRKTLWSETTISKGDRIEVIRAVQGG